MGLFDSLMFDPSTYQNSGLLGQLLPQALWNAKPQDDQPTSMGNYGGVNYPIFGQPQQPQQAAIPPAAAPVQYQAPQQAMPQSQQAMPQLPTMLGGQNESAGVGDRLMAGLTGFANSNGPLTALSNLISGVATGQRTDPVGVQQQTLRAQYESTRQALISNGYPPAQAASAAMLAVFNPEAAKTVLPEALTNKEKYQVVSEDPLTGKQYGFVNERNQTVNGKPLGAGQVSPQGAGGLAAIQQAQNAGVTGEALYDYLPKAMAPTVKAMIEGRQQMPSTVAMRSPAILAMIDAAHAIDPTFDATTWAARVAGRKDFEGGGKSSEMVRAANQTLSHVGSLLTAMDNLKNRSVPAWNAVANTVQENLGSGEQGAFRTNAHAVAEEMSKVFKGANLSDAEVRQWEQNLSENMSPAQQRAQIAKLSELLHGSLHALEEKRLSSLGPMAASKSGPLIKPEGQAVLKRIDEWLKGSSAAPQSAPTAGLPQGWSVQVK